MKKLKYFLCVLLVLSLSLTAVFFTACGDPGTDPEKDPPHSGDVDDEEPGEPSAGPKYIFEAETDAVRYNCHTENSGLSSGGSNVCGFWASTDSALTFYISSNAAETDVTLTIRIASACEWPAEPAHDMSDYDMLTVNGESAALSGTLDARIGWHDYCDITAKVDLKAGSNTVVFHKDNNGTDLNDFRLNIDYIGFDPASAVLTAESAKEPVGLILGRAPNKTEYVVGETFDTAGMIVNASFDDGTSAAVSGYVVLRNGPLEITDTYVTIKYGGKSLRVPIRVSRGTVIGPLTYTFEAEDTLVYNDFGKWESDSASNGVCVTNWDVDGRSLAFYIMSDSDVAAAELGIVAANQDKDWESSKNIDFDIDLSTLDVLKVNGVFHTLNGTVEPMDSNAADFWCQFRTYTAEVPLVKGMNVIEFVCDSSADSGEYNLRMAVDCLKIATVADLSNGVFYEAEDAVYTNPETEKSVYAHGENADKNIVRVENYDSVAWTVNAEKTKAVTAVLSVATREENADWLDLGAQEIFSVNGKNVRLTGTLTNGLWYKWSYITATFNLNEGENTVVLAGNNAVKLQVDCLILYDAGDPVELPIPEVPVKYTFEAEDTLVFNDFNRQEASEASGGYCVVNWDTAGRTLAFYIESDRDVETAELAFVAANQDNDWESSKNIDFDIDLSTLDVLKVNGVFHTLNGTVEPMDSDAPGFWYQFRAYTASVPLQAGMNVIEFVCDSSADSGEYNLRMAIDRIEIVTTARLNGGTVYEAEDAVHTNPETEKVGWAHGENADKNLVHLENEDTVTWTVSAEKAREVTVILSVATRETDAAWLDLGAQEIFSVNGENVQLTGTLTNGLWYKWSYITAAFELEAGDNTLVLSGNNAVKLQVDCLIIF